MKNLSLLFFLILLALTAPVRAAEGWSCGRGSYLLGMSYSPSMARIEAVEEYDKDLGEVYARIFIYNGQNVSEKGECGKPFILSVGNIKVMLRYVDTLNKVGDLVPDRIEVLKVSPDYVVYPPIMEVDENSTIKLSVVKAIYG